MEMLNLARDNRMAFMNDGYAELLTNPSPLHEEDRSAYARDGYLILRGLFDPHQIQQAATEAEGLLRRTELIHTDTLRCRWTTDATSGDCVVETFDPVVDLSPACRQIATDARLPAAIGALYG